MCLNINVRRVLNGSALEILVGDSGPGVANVETLKENFGFGKFDSHDDEVTAESASVCTHDRPTAHCFLHG